jgi:hypothetical protein
MFYNWTFRSWSRNYFRKYFETYSFIRFIWLWNYWCRINNVKHEFAIIEGIREDVLELILNLKEVTFKGSAIKKNKNPKRFKGFLHLKGPIIVTAGLFQLPNNELTILNTFSNT